MVLEKRFIRVLFFLSVLFASIDLAAQTLPCPNQASPTTIPFEDSILSQTDFFDAVRAERALVVFETEFENLVNANQLSFANNPNTAQMRDMQASAAEANRLGTLGIIFANPQVTSLQQYNEKYVLIAVVRDPFVVSGTSNFHQGTDYYFVVGRIANAGTTQLRVSMSPMYASIQVNGGAAGASCACNNSGTTECIAPPPDGDRCPAGPNFDCGGGHPDALQVVAESFPGGTRQIINACTQLPQMVRGNSMPIAGVVGGLELVSQVPFGGVNPDLEFQQCTTCENIDCTLDMSLDWQRWTSTPPPRSICSGVPIRTSRDCNAGACYGDGSEAGASSDLSVIGACFGASGGGALNAPSAPHQPDELPVCKISVQDICTMIDGNDGYSDQYCSEQTGNFLIQTAMTCDGSSAPSSTAPSGYACCDGVANCACTANGNINLCTDCSSGTCVQFAYSSIVDPRLAATNTNAGDEQCKSTDPGACSKTSTAAGDDSQGAASGAGERAKQVDGAGTGGGKAAGSAPAGASDTGSGSQTLVKDHQEDAPSQTGTDSKPQQVGNRKSNTGHSADNKQEDAGDPVLLASGALLMQPTDIRVDGQQYDLTFQRTYVSNSSGRGMLGSNWTHNWEARLEPLLPSTAPDWAPPFCTQAYPITTCLFYRDGFGNSYLFVWDTVTQRFAPQNGNDSHVLPIRPGGYLLTAADGGTRTFNRDGYLTSDRDRFGNGFKVELTRTPLFAAFQRYCTRFAEQNQDGAARASSRDLEDEESASYGKMCQHLSNIFAVQEMQPLTVEGWERGGAVPPYEIPLDVGAEQQPWEQIADGAEETDIAYRTKILVGLLYLRKLAIEDYASKSQYGAIRYQPVKVVDDFGRELNFTYGQYNSAASLLRSVDGPGGVHLDFSYSSAPGSSEAFLTGARRLPPGASSAGIDNSQWAAMAGNNQYLEFEYEYDFQAAINQASQLQVAFDKYLAYFELYSACWNYTEIECTSGGMSSLADGNPCSRAARATGLLKSALNDNIIIVRRSGAEELVNEYDVDIFSDNFDQLMRQRYGASSELHLFQYLLAGPTGRNETASTAYPSGLPGELQYLVPEDTPPQGYASPSASCVTTLGNPSDCRVLLKPFGDFGDIDHHNRATDPPSGPRGSCNTNHKFTGAETELPRCEPGFMDDYVAELPGYKPSYEYYARTLNEASPKEEPLVQSFLSCQQLEAREYFNPFSAESIGRWQFQNGSWIAEWPEGAREEIELNLGRVCQWTASTDRRKVSTWYGLNYRGQHLVEATQTSQGMTTIERRYNADGLVVRETDPFYVGQPVGYTDYAYDEVTAGSNKGWGAYSPMMWATRQNLLEARYHPVSPVVRYNAFTGAQEIVAETFVEYQWEPIFNQLMSITEGSKLTNDQEVLHRLEYRTFDYQELAPPVVAGQSVSVLANGDYVTTAIGTVTPIIHHWLEKGAYWGIDSVDDELDLHAIPVDVQFGAQLVSGNSLDLIMLKGMTFFDEDINNDGIQGFNASEPAMRGKGVPIKIVEVDLDNPANPSRAITLTYAPHGELASVRDVAGNLTEFAYYPVDPQNRSTAFGSGVFPTTSDANNGEIGLLAYVKKSHPLNYSSLENEAFNQGSCISAEIPGPYKFILPTCGSSVAQSLGALGVPSTVVDAIALSASPDTIAFAYSEIGLPRRIWTNDASRVVDVERDADGRIVRELTSDNRLTLNTLDEFGHVIATESFDNGTLVDQSATAFNRSNNPTKTCRAAVDGACDWLVNTPNNPPATTGYALTQYFYDDEDLLTLTIDPEGTTVFTQYDDSRRPYRELVSGKGVSLDKKREKRTTYDVRNRVTQIGYGPSGSDLIESFGYDEFGMLTIHIDRRQQPWFSAYSTQGNLLSTCHDDSNCSPATTMLQTSGLDVQQFSYNDFDELVTTTHNDEFETIYTRRLDGAVAVKEETNSEPKFFAYDKYNNPVWSGSGDSQQFQVVDQINKRLATVSMNGSVASSTIDQYDLAGRVVASTQYGSDGTTSRTTTYAFNGLQVSSADPTGRFIVHDFDLLGRVALKSEQRPNGFDVTSYSTNRRGQTTQLIDPTNQITDYTYNGFGELAGRNVPSAGPESWHYDKFGRNEKWQQDGEWVKYEYNSRGDLYQEKWGGRLGNSAEEVAVERLYDNLGRATRVDSTNLGVSPFNITSGCSASGFVRREFVYEMNGRRSDDSVQVGTCAPLIVSSSWSTVNNEWQRDTAYPGASGNLLHTQLFDGQGRLHEQEVGWFGVGGTTSLTTAWNGSRMSQRATNFAQNLAPVISDATYDVFGARTQRDTSFDLAPLFNIGIERDVLSRVRSATTQFSAGPMRWEGFTYDVRYHLTGAKSAYNVALPAPSVGTHYNATNASVDAAVALISATGTTRTREQSVGATLTISGSGGAPLWQATKTNGSPGRESNHRLQNVVVDGATFPIQHDDRGRISTAPDLDLTYDVYNRLAGAQKGIQWEVYLYDGDGLMVGRQDNTGDLELYAWDGHHMIGAYEDNGARKWEAIFGAGQDELLAYYDYMNGTDYLPVRDWRNNLVSVFDTGTQNLIGHAEYTPEGRVTTFDNFGSVVCQEEGSGMVCPMPGTLPFAFNGQWRSSLTGLSYMRNRWYSPRLGQFMSHDPLHYVDSVNLYAFAGFDPINSWDPMGLDSQDLAGGSQGGLLGGSDLNNGKPKKGVTKAPVDSPSKTKSNSQDQERQQLNQLQKSGVLAHSTKFLGGGLLIKLGRHMGKPAYQALKAAATNLKTQGILRLGPVSNRVMQGANHIFGPKGLAKHRIEPILNAFKGDSVAAWHALERAAQAAMVPGATGVIRMQVMVSGIQVTVQYKVIDGVARLSTAFIPLK